MNRLEILVAVIFVMFEISLFLIMVVDPHKERIHKTQQIELLINNGYISEANFLIQKK